MTFLFPRLIKSGIMLRSMSPQQFTFLFNIFYAGTVPDKAVLSSSAATEASHHASRARLIRVAAAAGA